MSRNDNILESIFNNTKLIHLSKYWDTFVTFFSSKFTFCQLTNIISSLLICLYFYGHLGIKISNGLSNKGYSLPIKTSITLNDILGYEKIKKRIMNILNTLKTFTIWIIIVSVSFITSCSDSNNIQSNTITLSDTDLEALLFMLEEEKLARDTYEFLDSEWGIIQFTNIKISEQSHMDAIITLLEQSNTPYTILPYGEFEDDHLQDYYNQFVENGQLSQANALQIGATIEDLDIVDLQEFINHVENPSVSKVFESLKCGSGNHLRSFVSSIELAGDTYTTQFLTEEEYNQIISQTHEICNL